MTAWLDATFTRQYPGATIGGKFHWSDRPNRVTALFGPSGCGKTTLLRCLAGLERIDAGHISAFGETWSDVASRIHIPPQRRGIGFLFQDYMLFPHLTVAQNIAFGISRKATSPVDVGSLLDRFQLRGLEHRLPRGLSGGQQQRVALARVLAAQPRLLLLDEPLSALDGPTRAELRLALRNWLQDLQLPTLVVSHDAVDVHGLADDVVVMSAGRIRQSGPVAEVWQQPADTTVASIVGFENLIPVQFKSIDSLGCDVVHGDWNLRGRPAQTFPNDARLTAGIRAEDIRLFATPSDQSELNATVVTVVDVISEGPTSRVRLVLKSGHALQAVIPRSAEIHASLRIGVMVGMAVTMFDIWIVPDFG